MLITPSLLHVKTRPDAGRQEAAALLLAAGQGIFNFPAGLAAPQVLARLDVPVLLRGPEATEWDCVRADHAAMAEAGEWSDLLDALRFADEDRSMASGGRRVMHLISEGARMSLRAAIDRRDLAAAAIELSRFEAVFELHRQDYAAAHLLAQALIDVGTLERDLAAEGQLSRDLWAESAAHFQAAEAILDEFDPIALMSPLLAGTRYLLVRGIEDGASLCRDWFEDWCDLDPQDDLAHATHAVFMMPGWFGSLATFEKAARRAATMTHAVTGKAAYAIFHLSAAETLGDMLPTLDIELFIEGLGDYQSATGCQHRANIAANVLTELVYGYHRMGPSANYQLAKARTALSDVLWNRLHEVHLESWTHRADGLAYALCEVFGPALQRGARISRRGEGLCARVPRSVSAPTR
jgi:transposase